MQNTLRILREHDELNVIETPLDIELEIPHLAYIEAKKVNSKALLFKNPIHTSDSGVQRFDMPVLMNVFGSFKRLELITGKDIQTIANGLREYINPSVPKGFKQRIGKLKRMLALRHMIHRRHIGSAPAQETLYRNEHVDLYSLPILKTWKEDGGRFVTMGQVYTRSLDGKAMNVGLYRLQVRSKNELIMHWQVHKDANRFFQEYKSKNELMPVSIAIGGDPLYTWCAQAPLPPNVFELAMYGLIRGRSVKLVRCKSNNLLVPWDCDIVIEGFVHPGEMALEGKFGDHTGFYTPASEFPVLKVTSITTKKNPVFLATVVGKPPLEDKYMGYMTERVFLPLMQAVMRGLVDFCMPENGVFHNLILTNIKMEYPAQDLQAMHSLFGLGQMSFVKHAIFFDEKDNLNIHGDYEKLGNFVLDRLSVDNIHVTDGICDELDHAVVCPCRSGKVGIDATGKALQFNFDAIDEPEMLTKLREMMPGVEDIHIYKHKNPVFILGVRKMPSNGDGSHIDYEAHLDSNKGSIREKVSAYYDKLSGLRRFGNIFVFVDAGRKLDNYYMLVWRVVNSIDVARDLRFKHSCIFLDATSKGGADGYTREWPKETLCTQTTLDSLRSKGLLNEIDEDFLRRFEVV